MHNNTFLRPGQERGRALEAISTQRTTCLPHFLRVVNVDIIGPDAEVNPDF